MSLYEWLCAATYHADKLALREGGKIWDVWELCYFVRRCMNIPGFGYGQMLRETHVYSKGHWLICEEDGRLLYEVIESPLRKVVIRPE
ncbi:MAG: hypothetical protein KGL39_45760 [Patescibacteria group bacterium]|nr:hypothetical protein [Patescibacteria group bacterium]